jgi:hypothetical protein
MLHTLTLLSLSLLTAGQVADGDADKLPWKDARPVTMVVLDSKTKKPIPRFSYAYRINTPMSEYAQSLERPVDVQSEDGTFQLLAPDSCEIELVVTGENILGGFGTWKTYDLTADNKLRRIEVLVRTGVVITGTVVDARTGQPIAGASVSPVIFTPPLFTPDRKRAVKTDAAGKFTLQGVDDERGINVRHPEYLEFNHGGFQKTGEKIGENLYSAQIRLETGERLIGVVRNQAGRPIAGVTVSDGAGKRVQTGEDGSFVLASPGKWGGEETYKLTFEKDGYLRQDLHPKSADPNGFSIVLQPAPTLAGQVLDPQGQPVKEYVVAAGVTLEPERWCCSSRQVREPTGNFSLQVRTDRDYGRTGKVWIGVKAAGFALWDTIVKIEDLAHPITARLTPGVTVRGSIASPEGRWGKVSATLLPVRIHTEDFTRKTSCRQELGRMETPVDAGGGFRFEHVGAGHYMLAIAGPAISPISTTLVVAGSDLDAGSFALRGRGSVAGVVYRGKMIWQGGKRRLDEKRGPWAFAKGRISFRDTAGRSNDEYFPHLKPMPFKADEHGRFRVDGVPTGVVSVEIPYAITADIIGAHVRKALVLEEKTTDVRFFDTSGQWEVACKFQIGDGSPAQFSSGSGLGAERKVWNVIPTRAPTTTWAPRFQVQLQPTGETPASFEASDWTELDAQNQILLRDVQPGRYRVVVNNWISHGLFGIVYEATVEAKEGQATWTIPLGAGCITGATQESKPHRRMVRVVAVGKRTGVIRNVHGDKQGNFCIRYLPEDDYLLWAHDDKAGWCAMPAVAVRNNISDIGSHRLADGGTIAGRVPPRWQRDEAVTVVATDSHGIAIEDPHGWDPIGDRFKISNLWPGKWTVMLKRGDQGLARQAVTLQATEAVTVELMEE